MTVISKSFERRHGKMGRSGFWDVVSGGSLILLAVTVTELA